MSPDAGHTALICLAEEHGAVDVITLTTEEEGVGLPVWCLGRRAQRRVIDTVQWCW